MVNIEKKMALKYGKLKTETMNNDLQKDDFIIPDREMIEYRGEIIEKMGRGFLWSSILWPTWEMVTVTIDSSFNTTQTNRK